MAGALAFIVRCPWCGQVIDVDQPDIWREGELWGWLAQQSHVVECEGKQ